MHYQAVQRPMYSTGLSCRIAEWWSTVEALRLQRLQKGVHGLIATSSLKHIRYIETRTLPAAVVHPLSVVQTQCLPVLLQVVVQTVPFATSIKPLPGQDPVVVVGGRHHRTSSWNGSALFTGSCNNLLSYRF